MPNFGVFSIWLNLKNSIHADISFIICNGKSLGFMRARRNIITSAYCIIFIV